jgi:thioredoxin 2
MEKIKVVCPHCKKVNAIPKKDSYSKANCGHCKESLLNNSPVTVNENDFYQFINNSDLPVVVDFWANWCGPCKMFAPTFSAVSQEFALKAQFIKVETDQNQNLSASYQIRSIPTLKVFKNGREVANLNGALGADDFRKWVRSYL